MSSCEIIREFRDQNILIENHPMREAYLDEKNNYIKGIALAIGADDKVADEEKEYLQILLQSLDLPLENLEDYIEFAVNPNSDFLPELKGILEKPEYADFFIIDCFSVIYADKEYHEKEKELIGLLIETFKLNKSSVANITEIMKLIYLDFDQNDDSKISSLFVKLILQEENIRSCFKTHLKAAKINIEKMFFDFIDREMKFPDVPIKYDQKDIFIANEFIKGKVFKVYLDYLEAKGEIQYNKDGNPVYSTNITFKIYRNLGIDYKIQTDWNTTNNMCNWLTELNNKWVYALPDKGMGKIIKEMCDYDLMWANIRDHCFYYDFSGTGIIYDHNISLLTKYKKEPKESEQ